SSDELCKHLHHIKDTKVLKYLCDNNKISLKKKDIRKYHQNCYLFLLNYLISENLITITNADVISIFKKRKMKNNNDESKNNRNNGRIARRRAYRRYRRYN